MIGIPEGVKRDNGSEAILEEIMAKNFQKLIKDTKIQKAQWNPSKTKKKKKKCPAQNG